MLPDLLKPAPLLAVEYEAQPAAGSGSQAPGLDNVSDCLEGTRVVFIGQLNCGLKRESFECLLRHCGARVGSTIDENTRVVALGTGDGGLPLRHREPAALQAVLRRKFPEIRVIDADELLSRLQESAG